MQISFSRVREEPLPFALQMGEVAIEGTLQRYRGGMLLLKATLKGPLEVDCFRCGAPFAIMLDENVAFLLHHGIFEGQDDAYDVVEVLQETIDLEEVFASEIAMIESDYHSCEKCS